jgi:protein SCO1/2
MNVQTLRIVRYGTFALIGLIALVWAAAGLGLFRQPSEPQFGKAAIQSFRLTDQNGATVTEKDILGRPAVLFFGFTYCPDICPATLASMTGLLSRLGSDADKLGVYFVTVDPDRDTAPEIKTYLSSFDPRIRGLTGSAEQIAAIAKPLGVYYARSGTGDNYTMDHTASMFLLNADGSLRGTIAYGEEAGTAEAKLRALLS